MIICKICNSQKIGNGYCAEHSTSGIGYIENTNKILEEIIEVTGMCTCIAHEDERKILKRILAKYEKLVREEEKKEIIEKIENKIRFNSTDKDDIYYNQAIDELLEELGSHSLRKGNEG